MTGNVLIYLAKPDLLDSTLRDFFGDQRFVPICPDDRLYLSVRGHGDDARFAGIFRDAWLNIPLEDRMQIIEYWRPHERIPGVLGIRIMMENLSSMRSREITAVCELLGTSLNFYSPVVDRLLPKHVAVLVAHELAHVYQATNQTFTASQRPEWMDDEFVSRMASDCGKSMEEMEMKLLHLFNPVEHDADKITKHWGFNFKAMNRWLDKHIDWNDLPKPVY